MEDNTAVEIFTTIESNFHQLNQLEQLRTTLKLISNWIEDCNTPVDISSPLCKLLKQHNQTDADVAIVVQIIYQILYSLNKTKHSTIQIEKQVLFTILELLRGMKCDRMITNLLSCIRLYIKRFDKHHELLEEVWQMILVRQQVPLLLTGNDLGIVLHLFDDISQLKSYNEHSELINNTIKNLLNSEERQERKCGLYLLGKSIDYLDNTKGKCFCDNAGSVSDWNIYITIFKNAEEQQSHLVLPAISNLDVIRKSSIIFNDWKIILYSRILKHKNILVNRWIVEYFLTSFVCNDLDAKLLHQFFEAINSTALHNQEGHSINLEQFANFFQNPPNIIYDLLAKINWKSLPLYICLKYIRETADVSALKLATIFTIAARIRAMQNYYIRQKAIDRFNNIFKDKINAMNLREYITLLETLYNPSDCFSHYCCLFKRNCTQDADDMPVMPVKVYKLLRNNIDSMTNTSEYLEFVNLLPNNFRKWFLYLGCYLIDETNKSAIGNMLQKYFQLNFLKGGLNNIIISFTSGWDATNLEQLQQEARLAAIHFYLNYTNCEHLNPDQIKQILIHELPGKTLCSLWQKYIKSSEIMELYDGIVNKIFNMKFYENGIAFILSDVSEYLIKSKDVKRLHSFMETMVNNLPNVVKHFEKNPLNNFNLLGLDETYLFLNDKLITGDDRIESIFLIKDNADDYCFGKQYINKQWLRSIRTYGHKDYVQHLLNSHKEQTNRKTRYFENSLEHRFKFRIACGVFNSKDYLTNDIIEDIWSLLLVESNQLNVTIIYEYIICEFLLHSNKRNTFFENIVSNIDAYTSGHQLSILAIIINCCKAKGKCIPIECCEDLIVKQLLSLSLGPNFQVRFYAQVALKCLVVEIIGKSEIDSVSLPSIMLESLKNSLQHKLDDIEADIRINSYLFGDEFLDVLSYVTCVPWDEYCSTTDVNPIHEKYKIFFEKKSKKSKELEAITSTDTMPQSMLQMQLKRICVDDVIASDGLLAHSRTDIGMIVVASLVENLPNLGGIARSCEVFGITQLVLRSKKAASQPDFTNLSMTAEKSLDIIEVTTKNVLDFVLAKRLEGYQIIGAEQTDNSVCLTDFQFSKKCILLLGHEKDGIPAPLLNCLDSVVEIPQVGKVRSLNVHVSAALFMWQYSKQHIL